MTALDQDRKLLGLFLRELVKVKPPCHPKKLGLNSNIPARRS
jgi:hypothetical protein